MTNQWIVCLKQLRILSKLLSHRVFFHIPSVVWGALFIVYVPYKLGMPHSADSKHPHSRCYSDSSLIKLKLELLHLILESTWGNIFVSEEFLTSIDSLWSWELLSELYQESGLLSSQFMEVKMDMLWGWTHFSGFIVWPEAPLIKFHN